MREQTYATCGTTELKSGVRTTTCCTTVWWARGIADLNEVFSYEDAELTTRAVIEGQRFEQDSGVERCVLSG